MLVHIVFLGRNEAVSIVVVFLKDVFQHRLLIGLVPGIFIFLKVLLQVKLDLEGQRKMPLTKKPAPMPGNFEK